MWQGLHIGLDMGPGMALRMGLDIRAENEIDMGNRSEDGARNGTEDETEIRVEMGQ